jgi:hypothetical protein
MSLGNAGAQKVPPAANILSKLVGFIALDWSLMIFTLCIILLRFAVRHRGARLVPGLPKPVNSRAAILSDIFVITSWLSGIVLILINTWKNHQRFEYRHDDPAQLYYGVPHDLASHLLYESWLSLYFIYISLYFSKAAFIAFYYDLFFDHSKKMRIMLLGTSVLTFLTFMVQMMLLSFWCQPVNLNW